MVNEKKEKEGKLKEEAGKVEKDQKPTLDQVGKFFLTFCDYSSKIASILAQFSHEPKNSQMNEDKIDSQIAKYGFMI